MAIEKLKFLENAIETAVSEISEELELILEGSDPKASVEVINKMLQDLLDSAKNPERFLLEDELREMEDGRGYKYGTDQKEIPFQFKMGESVIMEGNYFIAKEGTKEALGFPGDKTFQSDESIKIAGEEGIVVARKAYNGAKDKSMYVYVVDINGTKYGVYENQIKKTSY